MDRWMSLLVIDCSKRGRKPHSHAFATYPFPAGSPFPIHTLPFEDLRPGPLVILLQSDQTIGQPHKSKGQPPDMFFRKMKMASRSNWMEAGSSWLWALQFVKLGPKMKVWSPKHMSSGNSPGYLFIVSSSTRFVGAYCNPIQGFRIAVPSKGLFLGGFLSTDHMTVHWPRGLLQDEVCYGNILMVGRSTFINKLPILIFDIHHQLFKVDWRWLIDTDLPLFDPIWGISMSNSAKGTRQNTHTISEKRCWHHRMDHETAI